jgi:hypothetical protein
MVASLIVAVIVGFIAGLFVFPFLPSDTAREIAGNVIGACIAFYFGLLVLKSLPEKEFSDFKVVLIARDTEVNRENIPPLTPET